MNINIFYLFQIFSICTCAFYFNFFLNICAIMQPLIFSNDHSQLPGSVVLREYFNFPTPLCLCASYVSSKYQQSLASIISFFFHSRSVAHAHICIEMKTFPFVRHLHCIDLLSSLLPSNGRSLFHEFVHIRHSQSLLAYPCLSWHEIIRFPCFIIFILVNFQDRWKHFSAIIYHLCLPIPIQQFIRITCKLYFHIIREFFLH